jgi:hypothetical protein
LPDAAAKINNNQETIIATVTMVQIKNVAERTMSWTKSQTDESQSVSFFIPKNLLIWNLHCQFKSVFWLQSIHGTVSSANAVQLNITLQKIFSQKIVAIRNISLVMNKVTKAKKATKVTKC